MRSKVPGLLALVTSLVACSASYAQTWSISYLNCALTSELTGSTYAIGSADISSVIFFSGGACTQSCTNAMFYPAATVVAYAGLSQPCQIPVAVSFQAQFITSGTPEVYVTVSGTPSGAPQWTLAAWSWQDCTQKFTSSEAATAPCTSPGIWGT